MKALGFLFVILFSACAKNEPVIKRGFYYWKTQFVLNDIELGYLDTLKASSLYVRIFDVDWDYNTNQAIPKGSQSVPPVFPQGIIPVPTIYLTNRTFKKTPVDSIDRLAQKVINYSKKILFNWSVLPSKIQFDVDWTPSTKDKYFKFLKTIRASGQFEKISTTVRLHQFKYPHKTGIPPADEGILMAYNTGAIKNWETENSIATLEDIERYTLRKAVYPIPLGVALPIFSWTVIFRDSTFFKIVSDGDLSWQGDTTHFELIAPNRYVVKSSTYLSGHYLYEGDLLRYEFITPKALKSFAERLQKHPKQSYQELLLYHLEEQHLEKYGLENLEIIYGVFD